MANVADFEDRLGIRFSSRELLQQVFVHRSYLNEHRGFPLGDNERLEFLGDAVLELVVTEFLYKNYPNPEGELTTWRSALVKGETLASIATEMGFPEFLLLSYGEEKSGGKAKGYILANTFEAFIGGLYLDQGYAAAEKFIMEHVLVRLENILQKKLFLDPKSKLQEFTQEHFSQTPSYVVRGEDGPDHAKQFTVSVHIGDRELARGTGGSKQAAQVAAAEAAIVELEK
jgi:ribonuclease III